MPPEPALEAFIARFNLAPTMEEVRASVAGGLKVSGGGRAPAVGWGGVGWMGLGMRWGKYVPVYPHGTAAHGWADACCQGQPAQPPAPMLPDPCLPQSNILGRHYTGDAKE